MLDPDDLEWLADTPQVTNPGVEVFFLVKDYFYTGDPNRREQFDSPAYRVLLAQPEIARHAETGWLASRDILGKEKLLAGHYREVIDRGFAGRQGFDELGYHFWMTLMFSWDGGRLVVPWHDTWTEIDCLIGRLPHLVENEAENDIEEGWEFVMVRRGEQLFFRVGDGNGAEVERLAFDRAALLRSVAEVTGRVPPIIAELTQFLGADVWTERRYRQKFTFGTSDWTPPVIGL